MEEVLTKKHFVLIHGLGHGAWCWYKVKTILESEGHQVTTLDLVACGTDLRKIEEVGTFTNYAQPLLGFMEKISGEVNKVILVGHSLGGFSIALAAEKYPKKISAVVFVCAFMPDISHKPSYVLEEYFRRNTIESLLDTQFYPGPASPATIMVFGPKFIYQLYHLSPSEDYKLGTMLVRPGSMFIEHLSDPAAFSSEGYGSVSRVYIVGKEDQGLTEDYQRWMIENYPVKEVKVIEGADHMPMFSKPQELCTCLQDIGNKY